MTKPEQPLAEECGGKCTVDALGDFPVAPAPRRFILSPHGLCVTCSQYIAGEMMPWHDASPRCESGKRNHCTCDICF